MAAITESDPGSGRSVTGPVLALRGVSKSFGPVSALEDVTFDIHPGRIHGLVGENGAGKSTLVKIITGLERPGAGSVLLDGAPVHFQTPIEARAAGIAAVYQDPKLFPHLSVAENIAMGAYPRTVFGTVDRRRMHETARRLLDRLGAGVDTRARVAGLSVAEHQFVEIARALAFDLKVLILDEPTSALTPAEAERLFAVVRQLAQRGTAVVLITHRLEEILAIADDVTVLRDRRHVATGPRSALDRSRLIQMMVGRALSDGGPASERTPGRTVLAVEGLGLDGVFANVSFTLRAGEVVGMGGLVGAGRTEIARALFGVTPPTAGRVLLEGREIRPRSPRQMLAAGLAYLPEDRDRDGLVMAETIARNIALPVLSRLARGPFTDRARERATAEAAAAAYAVRTPSVDQIVSSLSGGNRQKVAFAKWLETRPVALLLDEPTHGIDVGSKAQVHEMIDRLAASGLAVLVISSDLPELLAVSDRILVVAEGELVAEIPRARATQEAVMAAAARKVERRPA